MKFQSNIAARFALAAFGYAAMLPAAHATDGVIEINQAKVNASGGYPYVISQSGSYRLTSNLVSPDALDSVIKVAASNVSIDMNGFTISGPVSCSGYLAPATCSFTGLPTGAGIGYDSFANPPVSNVRVRNGQVVGMGYGVHLPDGEVDHVIARSNRISGIYFLGSGMVRNSGAIENGGTGIETGGTVQSCVAEKNSWAGVNLKGSGAVLDSQIHWNSGWGAVQILSGLGGTSAGQAVVSRNDISRNTAVGVFSSVADGAGGHVSDNTLFLNGGAGVELSSGTVIGNLIHWNGGVGLNVRYAVSMRDNNFQGNNGGGAQTSGSVLYNGGGNMCGPVACP